jgi:calcineurin-like phosphoesterase family protein
VLSVHTGDADPAVAALARAARQISRHQNEADASIEVMTMWFTADLHLGHDNIIDYSHRPFADADSMNRALVERWNETVDAGDDVWVLGDFALGKIADTLQMVADLSGRKILLAGNHDRCWAHHRGATTWAERYIEAGFAEIHHSTVRLRIGKTSVTASHFPYRGDSHDRDRFNEHRPADKGEWLLHGHVHDRWRQRGRMINVGVDAWGYRPVSEAVLSDLVSAGPDRHAA